MPDIDQELKRLNRKIIVIAIGLLLAIAFLLLISF